MAELGKAYVQIIPTAKGITGMISKELGAEASSAGVSSGKNLGSSLFSAAKKALLTVGIGKLIKDSIFAGGSLQQSLGGTEAVFGKFASEIQKTASEAYINMGLSADGYMQTANKMASLFQGSGISQKRSLDLTTSAMQRASDVASVMGLSQEMAMESIAGAAKGNFTMMDNLGVAMNATTLQAYALEKGVNFNWNTASNAEKAELAIKMFMDRTSQYAGNFARESKETFEGSFGAMKAAAKNVLGNLSLGNDIMPSLEALKSTTVNFLVGNLLPMVGNVFSGLGKTIAASFGVSSGEFDAALAPMMTTAQNVANQVVTAFSQISTAMVPITESIKTAITSMDFSGIENLIMAIIPALSSGFQTFIGIVAPAFEHLSQAFVGLWNALQPVISALAKALMPAFQVIGAFLGGVFAGIIEKVASLFGLLTSVVQFLTPVMHFLVDVFKSIAPVLTIVCEWVGKVIGWFGNLGSAGGSLKELMKTAWNNIKNTISIAKDGINGAINGIKGFFNGLKNAGDTLRGGLSSAWNAIKTAISTAKSAIGGFINGIKGFFENLSNAGNTLKNTLSSAWQALTGAVSSAGSAIKGVVNSIVSVFNTLWNIDLFGAGKAILDGFLNGLKSVWGAVTNFVSGIAGWIASHKGPISYDKKLLIPAGKAIMGGFGSALSSGFETIKSDVSKMGPQISSLMNFSEYSGNKAINHKIENFAHVDGSLKDSEKREEKTPIDLTLNLGKNAYKKFVDDIFSEKDKDIELATSY